MRKFFAFLISTLVIAACTPPDFDEDLNSGISDVPKNMIYYTTADGEILEPYKKDQATFGATLISNTYEDGKGILTFDNDVTSIGDQAFDGCSGLTSITIPNSVTSIGERAFSGCSGLESFVVAPGNTKYDSRDNCNAIIETESNTLIAGCKNTIIPNSVTSIGDYAFFICEGLTSITIPNSVTSIGEWAFCYCYGLTSITIPNSVTSIGDYAFFICEGLTSITIPNSVTSIGSSAFDGCSGLTSITIPNSVTSIGNDAFYGCEGLKEVHIIDLDAWKNISFGEGGNPLDNGAKLYLNGVEVTDY